MEIVPIDHNVPKKCRCRDWLWAGSGCGCKIDYSTITESFALNVYLFIEFRSVRSIKAHLYNSNATAIAVRNEHKNAIGVSRQGERDREKMHYTTARVLTMLIP